MNKYEVRRNYSYGTIYSLVVSSSTLTALETNNPAVGVHTDRLVQC